MQTSHPNRTIGRACALITALLTVAATLILVGSGRAEAQPAGHITVSCTTSSVTVTSSGDDLFNIRIRTADGRLTTYGISNGTRFHTAIVSPVEVIVRTADHLDRSEPSSVRCAGAPDPGAYPDFKCDATDNWISWTFVEAVRYWVYVSSDRGVSWSLLTGTDLISHLNPDHEPGDVYQVAHDGGERVACTSNGSAVTPPPTPTTPIGPRPAGSVSLHRGYNYTDVQSNFTSGIYRGSQLGAVGDNRARSIRVPSGWHALACENANATGNCRYFDADLGQLYHAVLNETVSYLQVRQTGEPWVFSPGEDLSQISARLPADSTMRLRAGRYLSEWISPRAGMTIVGDDGAVLDGRGIARSAVASTNHDVTVRNLEITNYQPGRHQAAVAARIGNADGDRWVVENNLIHHNGGVGVSLGDGMIVRNNTIRDNRQIGVSGYGTLALPLTDVTVVDNLVVNNGIQPYQWDFHEGGIKLIYTNGARIEGNTFLDNRSVSVYCDLHCYDIVIADNVIQAGDHHTKTAGIFLELSREVQVINNEVTGFARSSGVNQFDIGVAESQGIDVIGNTIFAGSVADGHHHGLHVRNCCGRTASSDVEFRDNTIVSRDGLVVIGQRDVQTMGLMRWIGNTYLVDGGAFRFQYRGGWKSWAQWRGLGFDVAGHYGHYQGTP